jgi:hypothetical protein
MAKGTQLLFYDRPKFTAHCRWRRANNSHDYRVGRRYSVHSGLMPLYLCPNCHVMHATDEICPRADFFYRLKSTPSFQRARKKSRRDTSQLLRGLEQRMRLIRAGRRPPPRPLMKDFIQLDIRKLPKMLGVNGKDWWHRGAIDCRCYDLPGIARLVPMFDGKVEVWLDDGRKSAVQVHRGFRKGRIWMGSKGHQRLCDVAYHCGRDYFECYSCGKKAYVLRYHHDDFVCPRCMATKAQALYETQRKNKKSRLR